MKTQNQKHVDRLCILHEHANSILLVPSEPVVLEAGDAPIDYFITVFELVMAMLDKQWDVLSAWRDVIYNALTLPLPNYGSAPPALDRNELV